MYGMKSAWGGSKFEPAVTVLFERPPEWLTEKEDHVVSLVIYEFRDWDAVGKSMGASETAFLCTDLSIKKGLCGKEEVGKFIVDANATTVHTEAVHLLEEKLIEYPVRRTGYYCVWAEPFSPSMLEFQAVVNFQNSYGQLPAAEIPKLSFYGGLTVVYLLEGLLWGFLYYQHRADILPVQNYISAIIIFLIIEMCIAWIFYDYKNIHGGNTLSNVLMVVVAVLNAARNSFSFFLLLIVCMGYGVVRQSLGGLMKWVRMLAVLHFVFGVVYSTASLAITPDTVSPYIMIVIMPLAATLTAFYMWTLNSLKLTMKELQERKQHVKGLMYKRLWWSLLVSIFVIFAFFFLNSFTFAGRSQRDFVPEHWKTRWFVLDGWLNLVYLADLTVVAYLWRPTANNRRFAMSDELAQDEDGGFDVTCVGGSELDDEEVGDRRGSDVERNGTSVPLRNLAPATHSQSRKSVEEPIFEVGEGDAWSGAENSGEDDEDDEDEDSDKGNERK
jgi:hypothetical protein